MIPPTLPEASTYNHPCGDLLDGERRREYLDICVPLYKASIRGDWESANDILKGHEYLVRYSITENKETALHVAAMAQCTEYVERLLIMMDKDDLALQNEEGNTAFCLSAMAGNTKMAEYMVEMNQEVLTIRGSGNMMPLYLAVVDGKHDMVNYLYDKSQQIPNYCWTDDDWSNIFVQCIEADLFDVALRILDDHEKSVLSHDESVGNMLQVLAQKPCAFMDKQPNTILGILNSLIGLKVGPPLKDSEATQVLRKIWRNIVVKPKDKIDVILNGPIAETDTYPSQILFVAAEMGNINFLVELIRVYPDLMWKRNNDEQSIFHIAVIHRPESIYNLLHEMGSMKDMVTRITDKNGNNMLHSFAMSAARNPREDVSGAALLMHYELLWFKKVEAMIPPRYREAKNAAGLKPFEVFTENHKALASQGGRRETYINICIPLYIASIKGDLEAARVILDGHGYLVRYSITEKKESPLHVVAAVHNSEFVKYLVDIMSEDDLKLQNKEGNNAFCLAVIAGNRKMAMIMLQKNRELLTIRGSGNMMPLYLAAWHYTQRDMITYLYDHSQCMASDGWTDDDRNTVFLECIKIGCLDVALRMLNDREELPQDKYVWNVLHELAQSTYVFDPEPFLKIKPHYWERRYYERNPIYHLHTGILKIRKESEAAKHLLRNIWKRIVVKSKDEIDVILRGPVVKIGEKDTYPSQILFTAAKSGNANFLVELIREYPDLIWKTNDDGQTIFHIGLSYHHPSIFNLFCSIGALKDTISKIKDKDGNTLVHSVSKNTGRNPYEHVRGASSQLVFQLDWYKPSVPINNIHEGYWKQEGQSFQNYHVNSTQSNFQKPLELNPVLGSSYNHQKPEVPQQPSVQYSASQAMAQTYQPALPPPPPTSAPFDSGRVSNMQIPTNPRISSNLHMGLPKNNNATIGVTKPAYISVSIPKSNDSASSHAAADSSAKPGILPQSLRGYVERALARCKDDKQMAACQDVLKEVITKASNDGTLSTRDWDTEPLFALPDFNVINNDTMNSSTPPSSIMKSRRSPSRRTKSRWEPLPEEKSVEKQASFTPDSVKYSGSSHNNERDKQFSTGKLENKENKFSNLKFYLSNKKETNKAGLRPAKRQHVGDGRIGYNNGDSSSDSDKGQSLSAYYAGAITLADSPEERKRRESRSKRFEKNHGNRAASNLARTKNVGAGNLYTRRAFVSVLTNSNSLDDGAAGWAVEDIDWDSLTVKGTCQEIEKRYLRLTSAPDPATVRPEEILEKALLLVQDSQKNYLYKCDQLKSIRQDLTVQRIRNELTVRVYETHARLAIEVGDLSEYNQCQSQLQTLYAEGIKGCDTEFSAYNLLCVILHSNNNRDLLSAMSRLSLEARKDAGVKHALAVRAAVTSGNYILFFRLYKNAPNLNTCLMDLYVEKMRYAAVKCMTRSYRPTLPVFYVAQVLGFQSAEMSDEKDTGGLEECTEWLKAHGACLTMDNSGEMMLDSKALMATLFMPEPDDAVSHGDASLAVNDFLTRALS